MGLKQEGNGNCRLAVTKGGGKGQILEKNGMRFVVRRLTPSDNYGLLPVAVGNDVFIAQIPLSPTNKHFEVRAK